MSGLTFLMVFLILMVLVAIVPHFFKRFHIPAVVSIMLIGIIIGPNSLSLIERITDVIGRGYPAENIYTTIDAIGLLGL
ncbi:MAG: hypothetical protein ACRC37_03960, partial [Lentisphaeria bacterium]